MRHVNRKDVLGGGLMLLLGLGAAFQASHYELGSLRRMGPGYFPLALGVILAVTAALILLGGLRRVTAAGAARHAGRNGAAGSASAPASLPSPWSALWRLAAGELRVGVRRRPGRPEEYGAGPRSRSRRR